MSVYEFEVTTISGENISLRDYEGKVLLIVNTATKCGFAPQLKELQSLHEDYQEQGFAVLGFPCNQFKEQEPGSDAEIEQTCQLQFGTRFPMFSKIEVNGPGTHPLYQYLKKEESGLLGESIKWNFTKFLVDRSGKPVKRYAPTTTPNKIRKDIEALLGR
ncbi:glutathione peroxidase [Marinicrinis lubricantis]|uniref:Glutathione peroxidase n=1 Tax=Marinicrinis lubricantis TaxID=2086470 RepID=A0ABW1IK03_9BACL